MKDEWKDIIGFDGYQISDNGRVRSPRQILKQQVNHKGYCVVRLSSPHINMLSCCLSVRYNSSTFYRIDLESPNGAESG